jgi:3-deoxy-D-manno-octulosonic-acid transferase
MLSCFNWIFVQDESSKRLLEKLRIKNCEVCGDTRFDRVIEIAGSFEPVPFIDEFIGDSDCIVAGSTWKEDEEALSRISRELGEQHIKLVVAPHELHPERLKQVKSIFPQSILFSEVSKNPGSAMANCLIIDNMGLLSRLYKYSRLAYVGGGFTRDGVHNVLEAAVYGKPVVFGPNYKKYREAIDLVECGAARSFSNHDELYEIISRLLARPEEYAATCNSSKNYVMSNAGATKKIMDHIQEKRLLTR